MAFINEDEGKDELLGEAGKLMNELRSLKKTSFTDSSKETLCKWFGDTGAYAFARDLYDYLVENEINLAGKIKFDINPYFGHLRLIDISDSLLFEGREYKKQKKKSRKDKKLLECFTFKVDCNKVTPPKTLDISGDDIEALVKEFMPKTGNYRVGADYDSNILCLFDVGKKGKIKNASLVIEQVDDCLTFGVSDYESVEIMVKIVCRLGFVVEKEPTDTFSDDIIACC
jgi:hypothetical protein